MNRHLIWNFCPICPTSPSLTSCLTWKWNKWYCLSYVSTTPWPNFSTLYIYYYNKTPIEPVLVTFESWLYFPKKLSPNFNPLGIFLLRVFLLVIFPWGLSLSVFSLWVFSLGISLGISLEIFPLGFALRGFSWIFSLPDGAWSFRCQFVIHARGLLYGPNSFGL